MVVGERKQTWQMEKVLYYILYIIQVAIDEWCGSLKKGEAKERLWL